MMKIFALCQIFMILVKQSNGSDGVGGLQLHVYDVDDVINTGCPAFTIEVPHGGTGYDILTKISEYSPGVVVTIEGEPVRPTQSIPDMCLSNEDRVDIKMPTFPLKVTTSFRSMSAGHPTTFYDYSNEKQFTFQAPIGSGSHFFLGLKDRVNAEYGGECGGRIMMFMFRNGSRLAEGEYTSFIAETFTAELVDADSIGAIHTGNTVVGSRKYGTMGSIEQYPIMRETTISELRRGGWPWGWVRGLLDVLITLQTIDLSQNFEFVVIDVDLPRDKDVYIMPYTVCD